MPPCVPPATRGIARLEIRSIRHKAIRAIAASPQPRNVKGLDAALVRKIHQQITVLEAAATVRVVAESFPGWKLHELTPKLPGKWSMWVSGNYRLTFRLDQKSGEITDLDFEDYH